jgi:hypothetical protein
MTGVGETLQSTLDLFEMLLAKVEGVRLAAKAECERFSSSDVPILEVACDHYLRDTGHWQSPFGFVATTRRDVNSQ